MVGWMLIQIYRLVQKNDNKYDGTIIHEPKKKNTLLTAGP